ncbi:MAG: ATP-binding protein, partial [Deltaproteobacteria bacterium]|nr:ATP-binding protein [Deltaproteobacteria bacterium]
SGYDFKKYPVVTLTMTGRSDTEAKLTQTIVTELRRAARFNGLDEIEGINPGDMLKYLVDALKSLTNERVAVLIDEYDAPIQSQIHNVQQAIENRRILHDFYSALKTLADNGQLRLLFVTGVTKFAQASIFSVFNNLSDLTMKPDYNGVCGFTMEEFDAYIAGYLPSILEWRKSNGFAEPGAAVQDLREQILRYYDGYSWDGKSRVLNPFSLVQFLDGKEFDSFWFDTSTPTFLLEFIRQHPQQYVKTESPVLNKNSLKATDVTALRLTPLLFQTGYLTIERRIGEDRFSLRSPNLEVGEALTTNLAAYLTGQDDENVITELAAKIRAALGSFDSVALGAAFSQILKWISHQEQPALEGFHHALLFAVLKALHFKVVSEVSESEGRFDLLLLSTPGTAFIGEFKYEKFAPKPGEDNEPKRQELLATALDRAKKQIEYRRYDGRYRDEHPVVKRLAVGIVGKSDVLVEIY